MSSLLVWLLPEVAGRMWSDRSKRRVGEMLRSFALICFGRGDEAGGELNRRRRQWKLQENPREAGGGAAAGREGACGVC